MTVVEITIAIVLAEAILEAARWLRNRRTATAEPQRSY
jgi:hypothetical protein